MAYDESRDSACSLCDTLARVAAARHELALAYDAMATRYPGWELADQEYGQSADELRRGAARALALMWAHRSTHPGGSAAASTRAPVLRSSRHRQAV